MDIEKYNFIIKNNHIFSLVDLNDFEGTWELMETLKNVDVAFVDLLHYSFRLDIHSEKSH